MPKLSPEDLVVSSFETAHSRSSLLPTGNPDNPTAATYCEVCPLWTENC